MGTLSYDSAISAEFDDRTLAHLQFVIGAKLRRNEPFYFTWKDESLSGDARICVWVHPAVPLVFKFGGSRAPSINREWVDLLMLSANSSSGLHVVQEPMMAGAPPVAQNISE